MPIYEPVFHAKYGIGVIQVSPGNVTGLATMIDRAMQDMIS